MEIKATWGLGSFKKKITHSLEKVIAERRMLGLKVPEDFEVRLKYSGDDRAGAYTCLEDSLPVITINVLQSAAEAFNGKDRDDICQLNWYFDITKHILDDEKEVLDAMRHPVKVINGYEHSVGKKELDALKKALHEDGRKYSSDKDKIIKNARKARQILKAIRPKLVQRFERLRLSQTNLRHEMDHAAFCGARIDMDYREILECQYLLKELNEAECFEQIAKIQDKLLRKSAERGVIAEARGLFFDCVPYNQWGIVDYGKIKKRVYSFFQNNYIEGIIPAEIILPSLLWKYYPSATLTRETEDYLKLIVYSQAGVEKANDIVVKTANVNFDWANKILYDEIPKWKKLYAENAAAAVVAIGNAFKDDPSRFRKADEKATTFWQYISILAGSK
jgi:hypothetical protein